MLSEWIWIDWHIIHLMFQVRPSYLVIIINSITFFYTVKHIYFCLYTWTAISIVVYKQEIFKYNFNISYSLLYTYYNYNKCKNTIAILVVVKERCCSKKKRDWFWKVCKNGFHFKGIIVRAFPREENYRFTDLKSEN